MKLIAGCTPSHFLNQMIHFRRPTTLRRSFVSLVLDGLGNLDDGFDHLHIDDWLRFSPSGRQHLHRNAPSDFLNLVPGQCAAHWHRRWFYSPCDVAAYGIERAYRCLEARHRREDLFEPQAAEKTAF